MVQRQLSRLPVGRRLLNFGCRDVFSSDKNGAIDFPWDKSQSKH
jgi:hypothetical protein